MTPSITFAPLERVLDTWPDWGLSIDDRPESLGPVPGGRTNRNYRLRAPGLDHDLVLRINHPDPARLGIDRAAERIILDEVAAHGIGRPVLYWDPDERFTVFPWLEGRVWMPEDLTRALQLARLHPLIKDLGRLLPDLPRRSYHDYLSRYWRQLQSQGSTDAALEQSWREFEPRLRVFDQSAWQPCLTHHDLVPANILDTGERLVLIDWEYAAPGHPEIDLWTIAPDAVTEPFIGEMMGWINDLWERLIDFRVDARS